jgi:hypothetical protein
MQIFWTRADCPIRLEKEFKSPLAHPKAPAQQGYFASKARHLPLRAQVAAADVVDGREVRDVSGRERKDSCRRTRAGPRRSAEVGVAGTLMKLKRADVCVGCGKDMPVGTEAYWFSAERVVRCVDCYADSGAIREGDHLRPIVDPDRRCPPRALALPQPATTTAERTSPEALRSPSLTSGPLASWPRRVLSGGLAKVDTML